jgi:outer membrane biosynthesis protein TonB
MELLWPLAGPQAWYSRPVWQELAWWEYYSGFAVGLCVLLVVALVWAFLASFYFCSSTVIYFLLRRDVDKIDLGDVADETEEEIEIPAPEPSTQTETPATAPPVTEAKPLPEAAELREPTVGAPPEEPAPPQYGVVPPPVETESEPEVETPAETPEVPPPATQDEPDGAAPPEPGSPPTPEDEEEKS